MNKTNYKILFTTSILSSVIAISGFVGDSFAGGKKQYTSKRNINSNIREVALAGQDRQIIEGDDHGSRSGIRPGEGEFFLQNPEDIQVSFLPVQDREHIEESRGDQSKSSGKFLLKQKFIEMNEQNPSGLGESEMDKSQSHDNVPRHHQEYQNPQNSIIVFKNNSTAQNLANHNRHNIRAFDKVVSRNSRPYIDEDLDNYGSSQQDNQMEDIAREINRMDLGTKLERRMTQDFKKQLELKNRIQYEDRHNHLDENRWQIKITNEEQESFKKWCKDHNNDIKQAEIGRKHQQDEQDEREDDIKKTTKIQNFKDGSVSQHSRKASYENLESATQNKDFNDHNLYYAQPKKIRSSGSETPQSGKLADSKGYIDFAKGSVSQDGQEVKLDKLEANLENRICNSELQERSKASAIPDSKKAKENVKKTTEDNSKIENQSSDVKTGTDKEVNAEEVNSKQDGKTIVKTGTDEKLVDEKLAGEEVNSKQGGKTIVKTGTGEKLVDEKLAGEEVNSKQDDETIVEIDTDKEFNVAEVNAKEVKQDGKTIVKTGKEFNGTGEEVNSKQDGKTIVKIDTDKEFNGTGEKLVDEKLAGEEVNSKQDDETIVEIGTDKEFNGAEANAKEVNDSIIQSLLINNGLNEENYKPVVSYLNRIDDVLKQKLAKHDPKIRDLVSRKNKLVQEAVGNSDFAKNNSEVIKNFQKEVSDINENAVLGKKEVLKRTNVIVDKFRKLPNLPQGLENLAIELKKDIASELSAIKENISEDKLDDLVAIHEKCQGALSKHQEVKAQATMDESANHKGAVALGAIKRSVSMIKSITSNRGYAISSAAAGSDVPAWESAVWVNGFLGSSKDKVNQDKNRQSFFGGSVGYEFKFDDSALLGFALTIARDNSKSGLEKMGNTNYLLSMYNSTKIDEVVLGGGLFIGAGNAKSTRSVVAADTSVTTANGDFGTRAAGLHANVGYRLTSDQHVLIPSVGIDYSYALNKAYKESGTATDLKNVDDYTGSNLAAEVALQYAYNIDTSMGRLVPSLQIGFIGDLMQKHSSVKQKVINGTLYTSKVKVSKTRAIKIVPALKFKNPYYDLAISYHREQGLKTYMTQVGSVKLTIKF